MKLFGILIFLALAILAMRGARWAYAAFVLFILLSFPAQSAFHLDPKPCGLTFGLPDAIQSLSNYGHIWLFGFFFLVTALHFRLLGWRSLAWAIAVTMAMGAAVELAQGISGNHHCKTVDLIPDFIGALVGLVIVILAGKVLSLSRAAPPRTP